MTPPLPAITDSKTLAYSSPSEISVYGKHNFPNIDLISDPSFPHFANQWAGRSPLDIDLFDFTQPGEELRTILFGRGDWLVPMRSGQPSPTYMFGEIDDQDYFGALSKPMLSHQSGSKLRLY